MVLLIFISVFIYTLFTLSSTCPYNKLVQSITYNDRSNGTNFNIFNENSLNFTCTNKSYDLCSICFSSNTTCRRYADLHSWRNYSYLLTNVTISKNSSQIRTNRTCCRSVNLNLTHCKNYTWANPIERPPWTIDIQRFNKTMKCKQAVVLKDLTPIKDPFDKFSRMQFVLNICCLNYSNTTCPLGSPSQPPPQSVSQAILPVGPKDVGVGLSVGHSEKMDCQTKKVVVTTGTSPGCDQNSVSNSFRDAEACCKKCVAAKAMGCTWLPKDVAMMVHNIDKATCSICKKGFSSPGNPLPGAVTFVPS